MKNYDMTKLTTIFKTTVTQATKLGEISNQASTTSQAQKLARIEDEPVTEEE